MKKYFHNICKFILIIITNISSLASANNIISEVKTYINNLDAALIDFQQIHQEANKTSINTGLLILDKPDKFRCQYDPPFPLLIIGNTKYVSIYDFEMNNLTRVPAQENIFDFLLKNQVNFENELDILSAEEKNDLYILRTKHKKTEKITEIAFNKKNKQLAYLTIFEGSSTTQIIFDKTQKLVKTKAELFILKEPSIFGTPVRYNREKINQMIVFKK